MTVKTRTRNATAGDHPLACLDRKALDQAVTHLTTTGATEVKTGGHTIEATLPENTTGTAVLAMTNIPGWQCSSPIKDFHGLISLPLTPGTKQLSCIFTPKGLTPGLAGGALGLMVLIGVAVTGLRRRGAGS